MITKVFMPKLSDAMETGKVVKWLKKEGDPVKGGDLLVEVETDKANVEIEAFGAGVLRKIVVAEGGTVPVGEMIGVIADPTEDISSMAAAAAKPAPAAAAPAPKPAPAPAAAPAAAGPLPGMESYQSVPATTAVVALAPAATAAPAPTDGRVKASPLARKIAGQAGVDLRLIQGTGPGGRIIRRDVEAAQAAPRPAAVPAGAPQPAGAPRPTAVPARPQFVIPPRPEAEFEDVAMSPMRAAIAKRMPMSKAPVPHFYVTSEVAMDEVWALRERLNALDGQPKISVTDMVIKAVALALLKNPGVNAQLNGQAIRVHHRAHIGIAVALDQGLITPVLRDCDVKPLARIAVESRDLAARARGGKLRAQEISGATFSISNLGMYDVEEFSAIINPPEGAILAVGSVLQKPVVEDGELRVGRRMKMTISCDHRVMDGAMGARFLQDVKRLLEEPLRLLV
jgi:pyruvate dehydrogenase E2 component (dihydrolipoamide acetyltransferase)